MRYLLPFVAAVLIAVSCTPISEAPVVTATALTDGGTLQLTWADVTGASSYNVYLDGVKTAGVTSPYNVTTVAKVIEVSASSSAGEGPKSSAVNTGVVATSNVSVDNVGGAGPNYAFYFNASGTALPITLGDAALIDFVCDTSGVETELRSPDAYTTPYNNMDNGVANTSGSTFDTYDMAEATVGNYLTARTITSGGLYALWIDPTANAWSTDDHFAKMTVEGVSGNTLTLTFGYQLIGGLRWLDNQ